MFHLPASMLSAMEIFSPVFSTSTYQNLLLLVFGHILCKGRRTVTEVLRQLGLKNTKNFSKYHEVFSKAKWSALATARALFLKLITLSQGNILVSIDSTVERRKGPKIKGLGRQRDAVRSSKNKKVLTIGLNWLVTAVHITLPWCSRCWALPFLTILMPPERPLSSSKNRHDMKRTKHKTLNDWASQVAVILCRWLGPYRNLTLVADSCFATYKLANTCLDLGISLISRMRLDARFYGFPPAQSEKKGRKRIVGSRLATPKAILEQNSHPWTAIEVNWYGGERKNIEFLTETCLWYGYGIRPVPIRWVLVRDPKGSFDAVCLFSTNVSSLPVEIVEVFVARWQIEVTFEEARRHLGVETQRQWSDLAIDRVTPSLFASFSIINLIALEFNKTSHEAVGVQTCSWYKKKHVTFSDVLAYVREKLLRGGYFLGFEKKFDPQKFDVEQWIVQMAAA
jgi:hypothetical protein